MSFISRFFSSSALVFFSAFLLRGVLLIYGIYQDAHSALKYTDIDYYVFTDAARYLSRSRSPYDRATYRYTPLLAWCLLPTTWGGLWFHSGKALFAISDLIAGWLILTILCQRGMDDSRALKYASVWLLNPMVANISTRGSSEGLLCVLVMLLLWAFETRRIALAGALLGISVHLKIYPFIYGTSMLWALESPALSRQTHLSYLNIIQHFFNSRRVVLLISSLTVFTTLNAAMYHIYGPSFLENTFTYHLTRLDHRHNFSPYNTLLYLTSSPISQSSRSFASLAFLPQLILSTILIPLSCAKSDMPTTLLAQTLAFVTFNKVATSQYFLWYLIFLPLYLPESSLMRNPRVGVSALGMWIAGQAMWLSQGYRLEFLGETTFVDSSAGGLWVASLVFFGINCWILGIVVGDVVVDGGRSNNSNNVSDKMSSKQVRNESSIFDQKVIADVQDGTRQPALNPSQPDHKSTGTSTTNIGEMTQARARMGKPQRVDR